MIHLKLKSRIEIHTKKYNIFISRKHKLIILNNKINFNFVTQFYKLLQTPNKSITWPTTTINLHRTHPILKKSCNSRIQHYFDFYGRNMVSRSQPCKDF